MKKIILSIYDLMDIEEMLENDLIDSFEEGFMRGYLEASYHYNKLPKHKI
jgi:hypothetical protein